MNGLVTTPRPPRHGTVTVQLDRHLAPLVTRLHELPLSRAMAAGAVAKETYANLLQSLRTLHHSLERGLAESRHLSDFDAPDFRREEALARDLHMLGGRLQVRASEPLDRFESLTHAWRRPPCAALVGALYALERERKHSLTRVAPLAQALGIDVSPRHGLDYAMEGAGHIARRLASLQVWIDALIRTPDRAHEVGTGAVATLTTLVALHELADGAP